MAAEQEITPKKQVTHSSEIRDKKGHTTLINFFDDGSVTIWQWHTGFEHTCDDDLIILNAAEAEEFHKSFEIGLNRA